MNITIDTTDATEQLLSALADQLHELGAKYDVVVIGGSGLLALGLISRPTKDVDLLAVRDGDRLLGSADPMPDALVTARDRVARDFGLPTGWLNAGPTSLLDLGLPEGFVDRLERHDYGPALTVWFAARVDQIHFKLYAMADRGPGKHEADLRALAPTRDELLAAARWTRTHDPSEGYLTMLTQALEVLGVNDADIGP
jgi:hypothetical protein